MHKPSVECSLHRTSLHSPPPQYPHPPVAPRFGSNPSPHRRLLYLPVSVQCCSAACTCRSVHVRTHSLTHCHTAALAGRTCPALPGDGDRAKLPPTTRQRSQESSLCANGPTDRREMPKFNTQASDRVLPNMVVILVLNGAPERNRLCQ